MANIEERFYGPVDWSKPHWRHWVDAGNRERKFHLDAAAAILEAQKNKPKITLTPEHLKSVRFLARHRPALRGLRNRLSLGRVTVATPEEIKALQKAAREAAEFKL